MAGKGSELTYNKDRMSMYKLTEYQLQCVVKDFADLHLLPMLHVPNEAYRSKYQGYRLKREGMMPGASDCFFLRGNATSKGLWLELKVPPNKPSAAQLSFLELVISEGYTGLVAYGVDEAIAAITEYYGL
jgi:hypothetical protein